MNSKQWVTLALEILKVIATAFGAAGVSSSGIFG